MGLRNFHIAFVVAAVLLCLGFSAWSYQNLGTGMALASAALAVGLGAYGSWFYRKSQEEQP